MAVAGFLTHSSKRYKIEYGKDCPIQMIRTKDLAPGGPPSVFSLHVALSGEKIINYQIDRARRGYIGVQNHDEHAAAKFRNIRLTEL
jgi:hypothetical protein